MTWTEKETVIRALAVYRDQQMRKASREYRNLEYKRAEDASAEASKANALVSTFCELLTIPDGEAKI